ncbi:MAG TPA: gluconate 2-dehydrogenase subunit 3 family protein [Steroidobacteraceae bacterium]|nr:gluconate 2-dehydrogenase subunit 3 family protein [Steroidobacteraceae bacterium]
MDTPESSRRGFLQSGGALLSAGWIAAHWPAIARSAEEARAQLSTPVSMTAPPFRRFEFLQPLEALDVEAIAEQIVPSGATPGAREAGAIHFIDHSLVTVFDWQAARFRAGLADFQHTFAQAHSGSAFGHAAPALQLDYLRGVDHTPFFALVRQLTLLGMFTLPEYGGNYRQQGWKLLGYVDVHVFSPPFGYYDARYTGFVPYPTTTERHS